MYEIIGLLATAFVLVSFLPDNIVEIRKLNIIGSIIFVIYGLLINSFSTTFLNLVLILVHLYKLKKEE